MASCLFVFFKPVNKDAPKSILKQRYRYIHIHSLVLHLCRKLTARHRPEHVEDDNDEDDDQQGR